MTTLDALDAALKALAKDTAPEPDPDEYSAAQYAEHSGVSISQANARLLAGFRAELLTRRRINGAYYYRLAK